MMRMTDLKCKATLKAAVAMSVCFLFAAVAAFGQQAIDLTAAPTTATMPDGTQVPMWGYFCGAPVTAIASGANATTFTATTAFDGSLSMPVNGYIGKTVTVGGVSGVVTSNTATTLTVAGWFPNAGTSFTLTPAAWAASHAYALGQVIVDSTGNVQAVTTAGTSGATAPTAWGAAAGATTTDGTVTWTFQHLAPASIVSAAATTSYTLTSATNTSLAMPVNAYAGASVTIAVGTSTVAGVVASNTATTVTLTAAWANVPIPAANTALSVPASTAGCSALNPNSATLAAVTPGAWVANHAYTVSSVILDANGNVQMATTAGTSGASAPPTWGTAAGATTPDGTSGLVWRFAGSLATYLASATSWSPVVITVPTGQGLTINLTNHLSFTPAGSATANNIPTSIVIVGQVGGGLGASPTATPSPSHTFAQGCPTWFIASPNTPPGAPCTTAAGTPSGTNSATASTTPPVQGARVQSMATEVAAGATTSLTWAALKPGTYLLESGTHPSIQVPMGLIGVLVVTTAPIATTTTTGTTTTTTLTLGTAYPATATSLAVPYNAELPVEFSEIDPVQNKEVDQAVRTVGFTETAVWTRMTALGALSGLTLSNPGSGYTSAPTVTIGAPSGGSPAQANASATVGALVSTITVTNGGSGYSAAPTVTITDSTGSGATATASVKLVGGISAINLTNAGAGYTTAPAVTITDPTGTGATLAATLSTTGTIASITITAPGSGYTAPVVSIAAPTTGTQATATAGVGGGVITAITVTNPGSLYTAPTITITDPTGSGATATANMVGTHGVIYAITLTNSGEGYTAAPTVSIAGGGGTGAAATAVILSGGCGGGLHTCYPPAVNYTPFYWLINGVAFNKTNPANSVFSATAGGATTGITGTVLLRMVNAGLRMHTPSIVNSLTQGFNGAGAPATVAGFTLIAEDGNLLPNVAPLGATTIPAAPRVQTDVLMVPSKVFDALVNVPAAVTSGTTTSTAALPIYARDLALSGNASVRDAGMLAYISINNATAANGLPIAAGSGIFAAAQANPDTYDTLIAGQPFTVSDPSKGVIANDINVYGVTLLKAPTNGTITCGVLAQSTPTPGMCANGTFTYTPNAGATTASDSFTYCANNGLNTSTTPPTCSTNLTATVTLGASTLAGNPTAIAQAYTSKMATYLKIASPGLLLGNSDPNGLSLTVVTSPAPTIAGGTLVLDANGGFTASIPAHTGTATASFSYTVQNSQGRSATGTVTVTFPAPSNLQVKVVDAQLYANCNGNSACITGLAAITDYRWIIEEDKTFYVDPNCTTNSSITTPGCPSVVGPAGQTTIPTFGVSFHTSAIDYVAQGCTGPLSCEGGQTMLDTRPACTAPGVPAGCSTTAGLHIAAVCDVGNGACRPDTTGNGYTQVNPSEVALDPAKRYYISVLPGDAANPFPPTATASGPYAGQPVCSSTGGNSTTGLCGHTMSGAPIPAACNILGGPNACTTTSAFTQPVTVLVLPTPLPTGKLSVIVFEDDFPLNGEQDGGGTGVVAPIEPGLGEFNLVLWDTYGGLGDFTGQDTYDVFNMPLSNGLAGTIDPVSGLDACPVSLAPLQGPGGSGPNPATGMTGMIVTCPKYESDGATLSPLAGQAVLYNLMPDKFSVQAYPGADRIARGEQWVQTNTLDGQHPHDAFIRIGEPTYFQEFGPAGYHVAIGFANPAIINSRHNDVCAGLGAPGAVGPCTNTIDGTVNVQRISRIPDERLYPSGSHDAFAWTQCWVSLGDSDGETFMFQFCDANGNFKFTNVPGGNWALSIGDQWNDGIIDGLSTPVNVGCVPTPPATTCTGGVSALHMGNIGVQQWQSNVYTRTYIDDNRDGIWEANEIGIPFVYNMIHYRDGQNANSLVTDFNGVANFNETFPLFNWYVVDADDSSTATRYKTTGIHTVYDAGGPADGSTYCGPANGARACGTSTAYNFMSNTFEAIPLPADLSVPGAVYCAKADCTAEAASFAAGTAIPSSPTASTGRIDPPWVWAEGWAGLTGHSNWIDIGKAPYASCPPACATVTVTPPGATTATTTQVGENGGIHGIVDYASTRPFDDASQMIQQPWERYLPHITVNLYQEGFAADGVTPTLKLVDTTQTSSWDDWAQGFYPSSTAGAATGAGQKPYMSCPGQGTNVAGTPNQDVFYFTLFDQPNYLDWYNFEHNAGTLHTLPYNSQFKCYDAMKINNQVQPAWYDGHYSFPSVLGIDPTTGKQLSVHGCVGNTPNTACPATTGNGVTVSNMPGTNCTICVPNPTTATLPANGDYTAYDPYRAGTPMLPPGKYVVQVLMPPGYEVYKEEDKNLLIGDNFIAPVTQQFGGLGAYIFIIPDQASVASLYDPTASGYNPNNFQDQTTALGLNEELSGVPGFPGFQDPLWPCVGEMRTVPDYLSLFPQAKEVAPFAGATRPLCDRKEVTLPSQMSVSAKFYIYTSTHIASKYTGVITDDYTSEFDPFAPQFGEKFAPPNMSISTRDYLGNELSRVYSDHWGVYNGVTFSSWEVNPPNITGYSPTMQTQCMNDPGPIVDTRTTIVNSAGVTVPNPTYGQLISDPLYNPAYSIFCYENPYMPGLTGYLDTPVVPTEGFVGAGYNNPDCSYPDTTPAIKEVDGDGIGPYVSAAGHTLTITALGDVQVDNSAYSGPSANVAPFNLKTITRHYGFGATKGTVTIGGVAATVGGWSDTRITVTVPSGVPSCAVRQQAQYGGSAAQCGQVVITTANTAAAGQPANARQSIDTVTVTIGGKAPDHVPASDTIQSHIDKADPGDLIIVDPTCMTVATTTTPAASATCSTAALQAATPTQTAAPGVHSEMLIMWKPVRLQGVGAVSSVIDANAFPSGKELDPWRRHINCLFGLTLSGVPIGTTAATGAVAAYDPTGVYSCPDTTNGPWNHFVGQTNVPQIDRLPLEAVVGWDATLNGNLAEQLQEPSLMGAYEGAGITVLGKGVSVPAGVNPFTDGSEPGAFPSGTLLLQDVPAALPAVPAQYSYCTSPGTTTELNPNPYPSNFECNPSSIDGLTVRDSSQGGGGIFVHGWAHNLQIANNRVYNNAGTLSGGVVVSQGEFPIAITITSLSGGVGQQSALGAPPSCQNSNVVGTNLPQCLDLNVNVHNNGITKNTALGDELYSGTLSGGGGASFCTGSDYYKFNYNWVCGNLSTAEGGGVAHLGFIYHGDIEHNAIVLNQSTNPTIPTNGGGIIAMGTPDSDPVCGAQADQDCPPGLSDGTGPGLVINANLIMANTAESGSGGGIRLQQVNGTEVSTFPSQPQYWNSAAVTNNIIVNNVAGWDGAGISLEDSLNVQIINNTVASNDALASSGVLTDTIGAPLASSPIPSNCTQNGATGVSTASCPQSSGVTSMQNSPVLSQSFTGLTLTCPPGNAGCQTFSNPLLFGNIIWQNRTFYIGISGAGTGNQNQQNLVSLFDAFSGAAAPVQTAYGQCTAGVSYWDVGVRGDRTTAPNSGSGFALTPVSSILTSATGYSGNNSSANPALISQYCNGSRVPPTCTVANGCGGPRGYGVPPGIADATSPNPLFTFTASATVDEGNNWINVGWGPLALSDDSVVGGANGNYGGGLPFGNYSPQGTSPAVDYIPCINPNAIGQGCQVHPVPGNTTFTITLPRTDFFGNPRPDPGNCGSQGNQNGNGGNGTKCADAGAVEVQVAGGGGGGGNGGGNGGSGTLAISSATNATLATVAGVPTLTFRIPTPRAAVTSVVTITNTGTAPLTITAETLTLNIGILYNVTASTCSSTTPLAAAGTCTVSIRYATPTVAPLLPDIGRLTVSDNGSTATAGANLLALSAR